MTRRKPNLRVESVPRDPPDLRKLARAIIATAERQAAEQAAAEPEGEP